MHGLLTSYKVGADTIVKVEVAPYVDFPSFVTADIDRNCHL